MTLLLALLPTFLTGALVGVVISAPLAYRAGARSHERDQAEIARILTGLRRPARGTHADRIDWRPALRSPTAAHASLRVATTPESYVPRHGQLVRAHLTAADTYIGRPRELVPA